MKRIDPISAGAALAATVGIGYAACTLLFWLRPEAAANFMNALFHGLEFRRLRSGTTPLSFDSFLWVLVVLALWAFGLGTIFGWIFDCFARD